MSSNILPKRKRPMTPMQKARAGVPQTVSQAEGEAINAAMGAKKPRKTNMGNVMRMKNRRMSSPKV